MNKALWLHTLSRHATLSSAADKLSHQALRDALSFGDELMRAAPINLRGDYSEIDEGDLQAAARQHAADIEARGIHWPRSRFTGTAALFDLAVQIRALDLLLRDYDSGSHARRQTVKRWKDSRGSNYVIPTRRPRILDGAAGEGFRQGYNKRGTVHHRVVPAEVDGLPVKILTSKTLEASVERRPISGGAAVFPELELDCAKEGTRFLATAVRCEDLEAKILDHVEHLPQCHFVVWPELTIDDASLSVIIEAFRQRSLKGEIVPAMVLAGSWHRPDEQGRMRNRAPILDGAGRRFGWFSKFARFADKEVGYEAVESGEEFVVVVTEDCIAAVCICKDFSDLQNNPWAHLPVDVVLVASMGEAKTMDGHLVRAADLSKGHGRRTFVVQQGLWNFDKEPANFLLGGPSEVPARAKETHLVETHACSDIET